MNKKYCLKIVRYDTYHKATESLLHGPQSIKYKTNGRWTTSKVGPMFCIPLDDIEATTNYCKVWISDIPDQTRHLYLCEYKDYNGPQQKFFMSALILTVRNDFLKKFWEAENQQSIFDELDKEYLHHVDVQVRLKKLLFASKVRLIREIDLADIKSVFESISKGEKP